MSKPRAIDFLRKTNTLLFKYRIGDSYVTCADRIQSLKSLIDSSLYFTLCWFYFPN